MNIIIIGAGKLGFKLVNSLSSENHDITVIDTDEKNIERCVNYFDVLGMVGNGASYNTQVEAGMENADILIVTTESDEKNILCAVIARKIGVKRTIARVRKAEYYDQIAFLRKELGIDMFVNPDLEASSEIAKVLMFPQALQIESFAEGRIDLVEFKVHEGSSLANLKITDIAKKSKTNVLVCAVKRNGKAYIPKGDFEIQVGDKVYISASHKNLGDFITSLDIYHRKPIKNVLIIGGGRITFYMTRQLQKLNMRVKIIEKDEKRCMDLDNEFDKVTVIHGDATDQDLLAEENLDDMDAVLALTGDDRTNIILSLYAQSKNINKIVTKIASMEINSIIEHLGLDTIICPKNIVSDQILSYVRANGEAGFERNGIKLLYKIVGGEAEALEFHVSYNDFIVDTKISDLNIRKDVLVSCISRGNHIIFPTGQDVIKEGDRVLVVTTAQNLKTIDDIIR